MAMGVEGSDHKWKFSRYTHCFCHEEIM